MDSMLIVDDDPCFGALLAGVAKAKGFAPRYYPSLVELGSFARIKEFDIAIIDFYLECLKGNEIAEYVDTFFSDVPVIIVSAEDFRGRTDIRWPASVRCFVPKIDGAEHIVETARMVLRRDRLLHRLAAFPTEFGGEVAALR